MPSFAGKWTVIDAGGHTCRLHNNNNFLAIEDGVTKLLPFVSTVEESVTKLFVLSSTLYTRKQRLLSQNWVEIDIVKFTVWQRLITIYQYIYIYVCIYSRIIRANLLNNIVVDVLAACVTNSPFY